MTTAVVVYRSRTGTTRRLAEEIGAHLRARGLDTRVGSVGEIEPASLAQADVVLLGCWTSGLLLVGQHPDAPWIDFAHDVPSLAGRRVALFATYKLRTGSMFRRMRAALHGVDDRRIPELQSRDGRLGPDTRRALDELLEDMAR
jgi:flavodoxin